VRVARDGRVLSFGAAVPVPEPPRAHLVVGLQQRRVDATESGSYVPNNGQSRFGTRPLGLGPPAGESDEPGLLICGSRHLDTATVLTTGSQHLVERLHADEKVMNYTGVEGLVLARGPGHVPGVDEHVGRTN